MSVSEKIISRVYLYRAFLVKIVRQNKKTTSPRRKTEFHVHCYLYSLNSTYFEIIYLTEYTDSHFRNM